ncbi:type II toxin-antitoxin system HipA family toxin [Tardiphaga alba]|nr:type II toxin-antitoxin system HipA family toxin [Tardiphaga alba]
MPSKNPKILHVLMGGIEIGSLEQLASGRLRLTYADAWLADEATQIPLSMSLPLVSQVHEGKTLESYLWNLLPDNADTLAAWARAYDVSPNSAFALLSKVGEDCAGAVQFVSDEWMEKNVNSPGDVEWLDTAEVAQRLKRLREDRTSTGRDAGDKGHFSLAGAQPKMALLFEDERWGVPSGRRATTHILKPPMPHLQGTTENEHACLRLAARLGLVVADSRVGHFENETAIVVTRYDRERGQDGIVRRYHQEDMCQALGVHPSIKYENLGGPGAEAIARKVLVHDAEPQRALRSFAEALALNFLILGTDAHAKNFSVVHLSGRKTFFAPLYDILSYDPYVADDHEDRRLKMAMKIGGYYQFREVLPRHWERQAKAMRFDPAEMLGIVADLAARIPDEFAVVRTECRQDGLQHPVLDTMLDRFNVRCKSVKAQYAVQ